MHYDLLCADSDAVSWGAYHADKQAADTDNSEGLCSLLPHFREGVRSVGMIKHGLDILRSS